MILLDTNVIIDALDTDETHHAWAVKQIEDSVGGEGGGINAVTLAELCAGTRKPQDVEPALRKLGWSFAIFPREQRSFADRPTGATACRGAILEAAWLRRRPCRTFSLGAHAEIMGWPLATRDDERFSTYFPGLRLITP